MITDDPIRDLERQLVDAAARHSLEAVEPPRRTRHRPGWNRRRWAVGVGVAGAVCIALLAGMPFGLLEGRDPRSGLSILRTAAAVAAAQPATSSTYRYTQLIERETYTVARGTQRASVTLQQPSELWIDRGGRGRQLFRASRIVARTGDQALGSTLPTGLRAPGAQPYPPGGPARRPPLGDLPTDVAALLRTLRTGYLEGRISPDGSRPSPARERYQVTTVILQLLGDANATPDQRATLFEALARMPGVTSLGSTPDSHGREGRGVAITTSAADPLPSVRFEVIIDPRTSALLSWTATNDLASTGDAALTERRHIIIRAGQVPESDARP
ncbi:MAG: CU044_5270 family protein [Solirubrobacteraceae bacterium]